MTLWKGNGTVLKSSSRWLRIKRILKINNSGLELLRIMNKRTKGQTDQWTNGRAKNYMPPVYQCESIKMALPVNTIKSINQISASSIFKIARVSLGKALQSHSL